MAERGAAHEALRIATRDEHEALDGLFARFDLSDRGAYRAFLTAHAMAVPAVEDALDAARFETMLPNWAERRRTQGLAADLAALDTTMPQPLAFPTPASPPQCWGAAYVLEGSRLGGAILARQLGAAFPRAYLDTVQPPGRWRRFLATLDAELPSVQHRMDAAATARAVFALFDKAGRSQMEPS